MKLSESQSPKAIDPKSFAAHFLVSDLTDEEIRQTAEILYRDFLARGLKVVMDDRNESLESKRTFARELGVQIQVELTKESMQTGHAKVRLAPNAPLQNVNVEDAPDIIAAQAKQK